MEYAGPSGGSRQINALYEHAIHHGEDAPHGLGDFAGQLAGALVRAVPVSSRIPFPSARAETESERVPLFRLRADTTERSTWVGSAALAAPPSRRRSSGATHV